MMLSQFNGNRSIHEIRECAGGPTVQELQKPIFETDNPGNSATLCCLSVSSHTILCRSVTKLWLSHSYPELHFHLEKDYFENWQPYCL